MFVAAGAILSLPASPGGAQLSENQKIQHLLNRITFGPRPGDVEATLKLGIARTIERQLHPEAIDNSALDTQLAAFPSLAMDSAAISRNYVTPMDLARQMGMLRRDGSAPTADTRRQLQSVMQSRGLNPQQKLLQELQGQKIVRAVGSERQLEEVLTDFWFNHFNVFWGKGADRQLTTAYEMKAIRPHVLGKFKDLVMATAKSPAMLFYLDNAQSASPDMVSPGMERLQQLERQQQIARNNPRAQQRIDQQIAQIRERMAKAGTRKAGINENYARELMELHTLGVDGGYTQKDVQEVARAFTGWTVDRPRQGGEFVFREQMHDRGSKLVLGQKIADGGVRDGEHVIDILVHHPSTARFIATKLVRRFVADEPPAALVNRVALTYTKTDGDIREMLRTIFTSDEFFAPAAYRAKAKSPFELAVSAIRALGGSTTGTSRLAQEIARMGQPLYQYQAPTGYPDRASQWMTSGSLIERLNFGVALSANRLTGASVDLTRFAGDGASAEQLVERAVQVLLGGDVSSQTRNVLAEQIRASAEPPLTKAFALVLGSPEFQRR
jgi:uncharacterized protein (DUF1800 family)